MAKIKIALAMAAALGLGAAGEAHAWVQYCNGVNVTIWTAYEHFAPSCVSSDGSSWRKAGWWGLLPGECKIVYGPDIPNRFSYYYAEQEGRSGLVWDGNFPTCTPDARFELCDNSCFSPSRNLGYRQLDTGSSDNYTLTFTR